MTKEIQLTQGKVALVDDEDYERVSRYRWHVHWNGWGHYAVASPTWRGGNIYLHRFITDAPKDKQVDHINGNGLDCRKSNMRLCSNSENGCNKGLSVKNTSGYKGVSWKKDHQRWCASISYKRKMYRLGSFVNKIDAAKAYDEAARRLHGEFAYLNFPDTTAQSPE